MTGMYTPELMEIRQQALDEGKFARQPSRTKIECVACGQWGYPGGSWMDKHIEGHETCACGRVYSIKTINRHRSRAGHAAP